MCGESCGQSLVQILKLLLFSGQKMMYLSLIIIKVVAVGHMKVPECVKIILCVIVQGSVSDPYHFDLDPDQR